MKMLSKRIDSARFSCLRTPDFKNGAVREEILDTLHYYEYRVKQLEEALEPFASVAPDTCKYADKQMCMVGASILAGHFRRAYRTLWNKEPCE